MFENRYRIVRDGFSGFEVQIKKWWFPVSWWQCSWTNTHTTIEAAEQFAVKHKSGLVVKYLSV